MKKSKKQKRKDKKKSRERHEHMRNEHQRRREKASDDFIRRYVRRQNSLEFAQKNALDDNGPKNAIEEKPDESNGGKTKIASGANPPLDIGSGQVSTG